MVWDLLAFAIVHQKLRYRVEKITRETAISAVELTRTGSDGLGENWGWSRGCLWPWPRFLSAIAAG